MVSCRAAGHRLERHPIVAVAVQHLQLAELNHAISSLRTCVIERECAASVKREGRPSRDGPRSWGWEAGSATGEVEQQQLPVLTTRLVCQDRAGDRRGV